MRVLLMLLMSLCASQVYGQIPTPLPATIRIQFNANFNGTLSGFGGKTITLTERVIYLQRYDDEGKPTLKFQNIYHREFNGVGPGGALIQFNARQGGTEETGPIWLLNASICAGGVVTNSHTTWKGKFWSENGRYSAPIYQTYWNTRTTARVVGNGPDHIPVGNWIINP